MREYVLLLCDFGLRIPQRIIWYESFDVSVLAKGLRSAGYIPIVTHYEDPGLYRLISDLRIRYCLPATSWLRGYRHLVNGTLPVLAELGVTLIPSLVHVLAYEDKLLQVGMMKGLGLEAPLSFAVATVDELRRAASSLGFPLVIKSREGYGSANVSLVDSPGALETAVRGHFPERAVGTDGVGTLVVQEFLPGLPGDWKIIVVGNVAASLFRGVRPNDFRASGSGLFEFRRAPSIVLDFAYHVCRRLRAPWVSCDIVEYRNTCLLLEYQVVHFGTTTTDKAPFHLRRDEDGQWHESAGPVDMETEMAASLIRSLRQHAKT